MRLFRLELKRIMKSRRTLILLAVVDFHMTRKTPLTWRRI